MPDPAQPTPDGGFRVHNPTPETVIPKAPAHPHAQAAYDLFKTRHPHFHAAYPEVKVLFEAVYHAHIVP